MPCFDSIPSAAITTFKLRAKNALTAVCSAYGFPALDLLLNGLPFIRVNDRLVAVFDIVLRHFAFIRSGPAAGPAGSSQPYNCL